jgi:serine/threonine-protein kinase
MKKIESNYFLWLLPFFSFLCGYYVLHIFLQKKSIKTPNIIGKSLQQGMMTLSEKGLSLRLLREQEDVDLPQGIVLDQIPKPKQKIRPSQNIFVTVSKKPKPVLTPDFLGSSQKDIVKNASKKSLQSKVFWVKSFYPADTCIAQYPQPGQILDDGKVTIYLSQGSENLFVVPDLKHCLASDVLKFFDTENTTIDVFHIKNCGDGHVCSGCQVIDQKPMPGSIIDLSKTLHVQIQVE